MKNIYEILSEKFQIDEEELIGQLECMGISFRGYTIYVDWVGILRGKKKTKISPEAVVEYYAHQAGNLLSGCRTIAGITGDWRPIDNLAKQCLEIYKAVKRDELKRIAHKYNMELRN